MDPITLLLLAGLVGGGALVVSKLKPKAASGPVLNPPQATGQASDNTSNYAGSVGTLTQPKQSAPVGLPVQTATKVVLTPPVAHPVRIYTPGRLPGKYGVGKGEGFHPAPVLHSHDGGALRSNSHPVIAKRQLSSGATVVTKQSGGVTSPATFKAARASRPVAVRTKGAPIHPVAVTGQHAALHPEQDGPSHPLSASHGYAMHPATGGGQLRHISGKSV